MKAILRWYLRRILSRPILRAVDWTAEERNAFDLFCRTSCGIKLFEFLRQLVANATFQAVYRESVSANAQARGMQDVLSVLHRLRVFPLQEESDEMSLEDDEPWPKAQSSPAKSDRNKDWRMPGGRGAI